MKIFTRNRASFGEGVAAIARTVGREFVFQPLVVTHQVGRDLSDLSRIQDARLRFHGKFLEDAVLLDDRRPAHSKEQIGNALAAADHR